MCPYLLVGESEYCDRTTNYLRGLAGALIFSFLLTRSHMARQAARHKRAIQY
jgi:hypothetical protein